MIDKSWNLLENSRKNLWIEPGYYVGDYLAKKPILLQSKIDWLLLNAAQSLMSPQWCPLWLTEHGPDNRCCGLHELIQLGWRRAIKHNQSWDTDSRGHGSNHTIVRPDSKVFPRFFKQIPRFVNHFSRWLLGFTTFSKGICCVPRFCWF